MINNLQGLEFLTMMIVASTLHNQFNRQKRRIDAYSIIKSKKS